MKGLIGIDEVGRGSWAGPLLVVAARQRGVLPAGMKDSKLLSRKKRSELAKEIKVVSDIGEGWVMPSEIDRFGLSQAMRIGTERALRSLHAKLDETIIIDGNINYSDGRFFKATSVVDADALFPIVSAASIVAKVLRDQHMTDLPERYHIYEFANHVGYGTKEHARLLKEHGVCDLHRRSFAPIKAYL